MSSTVAVSDPLNCLSQLHAFKQYFHMKKLEEMNISLVFHCHHLKILMPSISTTLSSR